MQVNTGIQKILCFVLALSMVLQYVPVAGFAADEDNLCDHHPEHTAECAYVEGENECTYQCDECLLYDQNEAEVTGAVMVSELVSYGAEHIHSFDATTYQCACGAAAVALVDEKLCSTFSEAVVAASVDDTIILLADVTIGTDETINFPDYRYLETNGHTITNNGSVTINGKAALIRENVLYYHGGELNNTGNYINIDFSTMPTYWTAGDGYALYDGIETLKLDNATISHVSGSTGLVCAIQLGNMPLTIEFSGVNNVYASGNGTVIGIDRNGEETCCLTLEGSVDAVMNISTGASVKSAYGITCQYLFIRSGTVNIAAGDAKYYSYGIITNRCDIDEDAVLNISSGDAKDSTGISVSLDSVGAYFFVYGTLNTTCGVIREGFYGTGIYAEEGIDGTGSVNGLECYTWRGVYDCLVHGNAVLTADLTAYIYEYDGEAYDFVLTVPAGTSLTVNEGVTMDLRAAKVENIDFSGTIINNGTIILPDNFDIQDAPKSGIVVIGEKSYQWDPEANNWICGGSGHSFNNTGFCSICGYACVHDFSGNTGNCSVCNMIGGQCGENLWWKFEEADGTLTIWGEGAMAHYRFQNRPWQAYLNKIYTLVIEENVTTIGYLAFDNCQYLASVTIPCSVVTIYYAFDDCTSLTDVYYGGTKEQWDEIDIADDNCPIDRATIHYADPCAEGHDWLNATCTTPKTCNRCGETDGTSLQHNWLEATCVAPETCSRCGATEGTALGHTWKAATCIAPETCGRCGTTRGEKAEHSAVIDTAVAPTCTKSGLTQGCHCSGCGEVFLAQTIIPAKGHTEVTDPAVPATCITIGKTEGSHCSACGEITAAQQTIIARGHVIIADAAVEATCTAAGKTSGSHCAVCSTVIVAQNEIPPTGVHTYDNDRDTCCNVCGAEREVKAVSVPMFRMYDPNSGEHFYSGSELERDFLVEAGWHYEGVGFNFPEEGAPVHRLYDPQYGEHLYTMNEAEMKNLLKKGWTYEGVAFNSAGEDEVPQYRLHNPNAKRGGYHFTGSEVERDLLISFGWINEGIGWYSCQE